MIGLLEAALRYAELGYGVFPCVPNRKQPLTRHGFHQATCNIEQIETWWQGYPNANIGIATDGLLVIDVDGRDNEWLTDNPDRLSELATGAVSVTPRGRHYYFRQPAERRYRCHAGRIAMGVDIRADGGYVLVPPSVVSGRHYQWAPGLELEETLPEPPHWLRLELDKLAQSPTGSPRVAALAAPANKIPTGQRNATLARLAGTMRRAGMSQWEISAALNQINSDRCVPPLSPPEVEQIAASIARYEPDAVKVALVENHWAQMQNESTGEQSNVIWFSDIEPVDVQWIWPNRIPAGRITLLVGLPGKGKSLLTIDAVARVSTGMSWPDGTDCPRGSAILITAEDNPNDTIRPRLDAAGADVHHVGLLSMLRRRDTNGRPIETPFTLADVAELEMELARLPDCKLVVIDPIGAFLGGNTDAHRDNEVRAVLSPVAALAEKYGPAVVVVAHRRKSSGTLADDLALGSRAFTGLARAVWHVTPDPDNKARRLLLPGKNNLAPEGSGLAFTIWGEPPALSWESGSVPMNADECLAAECKTAKPGPKAEVRQHAIAWLRSALTASPRLAKEVIEEAREAACIAPATLRRAREELHVEVYREQVPGPWYWRLPQGALVTPADTKGRNPEHLEHLAENPQTDGHSNDCAFEDMQDAQVASPCAAADQEMVCG